MSPSFLASACFLFGAVPGPAKGALAGFVLLGAGWLERCHATPACPHWIRGDVIWAIASVMVAIHLLSGPHSLGHPLVLAAVSWSFLHRWLRWRSATLLLEDA